MSKTFVAPVCRDLSSRIDIIESVLRDACEGENKTGADACRLGPSAQEDLTVSSIVQTCMKKYCFKRNEPNLLRSSDKQNGDGLSRCDSLHDLAPAGSKSNPATAPAGSKSNPATAPAGSKSNPATAPAGSKSNPDPKFDIMHIGDQPHLVRYLEKPVVDEVSSCNSLHDLHDPNLKQPQQINTGATLQDCFDFDKLLNDFRSTAANAQLLRLSLSVSSEHIPDM